MAKRRERCKRCGAHHPGGQGLSKRGFCMDCATRAAIAAAEQMAAKSGPYYDRWLASPGGRAVPGEPSRPAG